MKRILIIEDETDMREALHEAFLQAGFTVESVQDSELGLQAISKNMPDLICLDILTPGVHGVTFVQQVRDVYSTHQSCKIIVLTNVDSDELVKKLEPYHIDAFFLKVNTSLETVIETAKQLLNE